VATGLRPDKINKVSIVKEGVLQSKVNRQFRIFPQAPRIKDCVRAACHNSGEKLNPKKQEN
jgi:hypothetical protein